MNLSSIGMSSQNSMAQAPVQQLEAAAMNRSADLSKDLVKIQVETMLSLGKMDYIATLVDMYV